MPDYPEPQPLDIGDIWADPYPGTGPVDYARGVPYKALTEQGLIEGAHGPDVLAEAARRREGGATLKEIRRDLGLTGNQEVTDAILTRAVDQQGRAVLEHIIDHRPHEATSRRLWTGIDPLPTKEEWAARQRNQSTH